MAARGRKLRRLGLALAVLGATLVLLELGARGYLRWRGAPYDGDATRAELRVIESRLADDLPLPARESDQTGRHPGSRETLHPYLGFENPNGLPAFARELLESRRAREGDKRFRVMLLGGSVAGIFDRLGRRPLAELLESDPRFAGRQLIFANLARPAFKQPQPYLYLSWALSMGVRPDAVLVIDGFNEVSMAQANAARGLHPNFPSYAQWMSVAQSAASDEGLLVLWSEVRERKQALARATERALSAPVFESALLGHLLRRWVLGRDASYARAQVEYLEALTAVEIEPTLLGPPFEGTPDDALRTAIECWYECSLLTQALCASLDIPYLHVLQPTLFDPGSKPRSPEEREIAAKQPGWVPGVEQGYPRLRELGAALRERGVVFLDASGIFAEVDETLYHDVCHFGEAGNRRLAEAIAPVLLELVGAPR